METMASDLKPIWSEILWLERIETHSMAVNSRLRIGSRQLSMHQGALEGNTLKFWPSIAVKEHRSDCGNSEYL